MLCGHYEGVDERVLEEIVDEELSIGDYVLTGGELPALVFVDTVGAACAKGCWRSEKLFYGGKSFQRPVGISAVFPPGGLARKSRCREVLLSGHHANIGRWRREQSLLRTRDKASGPVGKGCAECR